MTERPPTLEEIQVALADVVRDLWAGRISPAEANARSKALGRTLSSMQALLRAYKLAAPARPDADSGMVDRLER